MKSMPSEYLALSERIAIIERQNLLLKRSIIFLIFGLFALVLMGAKAGMHDGHFKQITTEKISFIDRSGQELMTIGTQKDHGTGIRIFNKNGKRVLGIGVTSDERGNGILIADEEGRARFGLGMDMGVPSLALADENGKKVIALGGDKNGYGLVVMDENEVERAGIGYKDGNTGIVIYDGKGQYVRGMIQEANGTHFSSYIDGTGKEIYTK